MYICICVYIYIDLFIYMRRCFFRYASDAVPFTSFFFSFLLPAISVTCV